MKNKPVILVVDDNPQNIELLEAHLVAQGYEIVIAANGEEALGKIAGNQIDLILLDVIMPGMDGFEVTRRVRQDDMHRLLPIILVTVLWEKEDRVKGIEAGCDDFISKPVDKVELLARVRSLLKVKAYNDLMSNYREELESEVTRRIKEKAEFVSKLERSEAFLQTIGQMAKVGGWEIDAANLDVNWTEETCRIHELPLGHKPTLEEAINYYHPDERQKLSDSIQRALKYGEYYDMELRFISATGKHLWTRAICFPQAVDGKVVRLRGALQDITDRKQGESQREVALEELRKSEENFRLSLDDSPLGVRIVTEEGETLYANQATLEMYCYDSIEELKRTPVKKRYTPESYAEFKIRKEKRERGEVGPSEYKISIVRKNGEVRHVQVFRKAVWWNGARQFQIIYQDITDRKQAEAKLRQQTDAMDAAIDGMAILNAEEEYVYLNKAHAKVYGYENTGELIGKSWRILYDSDIIQYFDQEIMPEFSRKGDWHGETIGTKKNGSKFPQELSLTAMANGGLICVVRDITERKKAEEELKQTLENLRKSVNATIQVMVSAIEMRDPYTAGHQLRSTDLAGAIATEMGLAQEKIDGIRMAGSIHDIGKLSIPAEILSKPTKLTNLEFLLIKEHPRVGYEMLKDVESPWPLAQIVYQHHERMDGSGYPRNLKGDEILMEARIMAVADVMEAMASHRPYRPALGIEVALEEIEKNKGIIYDDAVSDACLRLFREQSYLLP
jgi:PAS domain S-box-containing protein